MGEQFSCPHPSQRMGMKAALFLLCALGTSTSNFLVRTGEENVYNYQGKILTGIPELEQTFAGMAIECEVLLQGQGFTAEGPGNGVFKIALRNIKFNNFNEKLSGPEPLNWRAMQVRVLQTDFQWPIHWRLPSLGGGGGQVRRRVYVYQARGQQGLLYVRARACAVC